jgi:methylthioribose-1-phosphate isomerase
MKNKIELKIPLAAEWKNGEFYLLDQTRLPLETHIDKQESVEQVWESIKLLKVRGAPALGIAGAYGLLVAVRPFLSLPVKEFLQRLSEQAAYLDSARPTAVNLGWSLRRMEKKANELAATDAKTIFKELEKEAIQIHQEDIECCHQIGRAGAHLIKEGDGVLTHCNAGSLAVSELGTALAPMYTAFSQGRKFSVYADETRPLLQGARLTSWELQQAGLDITLICDNMAAHFMSKGRIQLVIVGTDRVAANGDVANKIGTLGVAILAAHYQIPFYVACPFSTIDLNTPHGDSIPIEERDPEEVSHFGNRPVAPDGIKIGNPAFDVTPNNLVKGFITEKGIILPPFQKTLSEAFGQS